MTDIILHVGAHRTATTAIQSALRKQARDLAQNGVGLAVPNTHRDKLLTPIIKCARKPLSVNETDLETIQINVKKLFENRRQVIISEENLLGGLLWPFTESRFYTDPAVAISCIPEFWPEFWSEAGSMKIILTIRNRADLYCSLYGYRVGIKLFEPFDFYRQQLLSIKRRWIHIVQELCNAIPNSEIVVFDYNTVKQNWGSLFAELGITDYDIPASSNRSFSTEIINKLLETRSPDHPLPFEDRNMLRKEMNNGNFTPFQPWSDAELSHFKDEYQRDLDEIQTQTRARLITATHPQ